MANAPTAEPVSFTEAYIRRALEPRIHGHGTIDVLRSGARAFTIVHRYISEWNGRRIALPVAQLRNRGHELQLFWRRANGRWVAYEASAAAPFVGSLNACLQEITHDRWGCFWG